jgi:hypothetical protein
MSYHINLYRKEVKKAFKKAKRPDFFEAENNFILPFTPEQSAQLKKSLLAYHYQIENETAIGTHFGHKNDKSVVAVLMQSCLSFSASGENGIFEIMMTASEFASDTFAKFDPQTGKWEK